MNTKKIFGIFILLAVLITCAGVSFASDDFDSYIDNSDFDDLDYDLDDELGDGLDDELYEDIDDESDDEDDWDDESDEDYDEDWDEDFDDESDDEDDWDDESDEDFDEDWEEYWYDDLDFGYWQYDNLDDINWEEFYNETHGNITIAKRIYFYKTSYPFEYNGTYPEYLVTYATGAKNSRYSYDSDYGDEETDDNSTDIYYDTEYKDTFLATCMPLDLNEISACYSSPAVKSVDFDSLKEGFTLVESQTNKTDDGANITDVNVVNSFEEDNILAVIAIFILCILAIL